MKACPIVYGRVEPVFRGETVICVGSGPSLTTEDVEYCRGRARVIAIKDTLRLAPWADVLYSGDEIWWKHMGPMIAFDGQRFALVTEDDSQVRAALAGGATLLRYSGLDGIERQPDALRSGFHSGYQAIQLALHLGAAKVVLLGYDMQPDRTGRDHFFGAHPYPKKPAPYRYLHLYASMLEPLRQIGVSIINSSRRSALTCFPQMAIQEALA